MNVTIKKVLILSIAVLMMAEAWGLSEVWHVYAAEKDAALSEADSDLLLAASLDDDWSLSTTTVVMDHKHKYAVIYVHGLEDFDVELGGSASIDIVYIRGNEIKLRRKEGGISALTVSAEDGTSKVCEIYSGYGDEDFDLSLFTDVTKKEAVKMIKNAIKNHKKVVRFRIADYIDNTASDDFMDGRVLWNAWSSGYSRPGADPVYDLLQEAFGKILDYYLIVPYFAYTDCYNFNPCKHGYFEYRFAYTFSKKKCDKFEKQLKKIRKSLKLKGLSQKKKALKCFSWITSHVKYDKTSIRRGYGDGTDQTPYNALIKRKAVCMGIAGLYYRMLMDSGVEAKMIIGYANGGAHAWVLVKIGKKWYNTDPTWDLGKTKKKYRYFLKTDKSFKDHKRYSEFKSKYFKKTHPMGKKNLKY